MKVTILYKFRNGPYGGVNQFLKALKDYFESINKYTESIEDADIVLFNSSNDVDLVMQAKKEYPEKIFVQRIDGPARLYNNMSDKRDLVTNTVNKYIADATIFQSDYSREMNYKMGLFQNLYETTIINAPDEKIFNKDGKIPFSKDRKIRIIASSWSSNWNKGFEVYKYLDENLDFNRYEMTFVGNTPIKFENIVHLQPLDSLALSQELKNHDIYITASIKDPCSNSLIEALSCGLPAIALNDGGHPEIVDKGGVVFEHKEEILNLIDCVSETYLEYQSSINLIKMNEVGAKYDKFLEEVFNSINHKENRTPKSLGITDLFFIWCSILNLKITEKAKRIFGN